MKSPSGQKYLSPARTNKPWSQWSSKLAPLLQCHSVMWTNLRRRDSAVVGRCRHRISSTVYIHHDNPIHQKSSKYDLLWSNTSSNVYIYMYIYIYIYMYIHMYIYIYICMCVCVFAMVCPRIGYPNSQRFLPRPHLDTSGSTPGKTAVLYKLHKPTPGIQPKNSDRTHLG